MGSGCSFHLIRFPDPRQPPTALGMKRKRGRATRSRQRAAPPLARKPAFQAVTVIDASSADVLKAVLPPVAVMRTKPPLEPTVRSHARNVSPSPTVPV